MADEQDSFLTLIPSRKETTKNVGSVKTYGKFNPEEVTHLAIHHTGGTNPQSALNWWKNPASGGVGAQFIIDRDGTVIESAPMTDITGHIMPSLSNKNISNKTALGIEIVAPSDKDVTPEQKEAVRKLYQDRILPAYPNIKLENILGHGELAKGYKGSHARHPEEGMSVVNYLKENLGKPTEEITSTEEAPNYLSLIPRQPVTQEIPEREYQPGYFNPNLVAQGERARLAGGGNLEPMVSGITDAIKSMNIEDWKKESLLANMLKYGVGSMPIVGDEAMREEGRQKLLQTGEAVLGAIANPIQTMQAIGEQEPGQLIGQMIKGGIYDAPLGLAAKPITTAAGAVVKPVLSTAGKVAEPIVESAINKFGTLQEAIQNVRKPSVTIESPNYRPEFDTKMSGVGAANADLTTQLEEAISRASPEKQNLLKQLSLKNLTEQDLKAIETHNKFDKFNMTPTEGQALQDITKMSDEFNARKQDPNLQARFEERDPKLIEGFNKIRETVAPDVYESNPAKLANAALEKLKQNYETRIAHEDMLYKRLNDAGGGKFPVDGKQFADNALKVLIDDDRLEYLPNNIQKKLSDYSSGTKQMNFNLFENLRTDLAAEIRTANRNGEGIKANVLGKVREELEKLPLSEESAYLKPLADEARNFFKEHKKLQENSPAYQAAINDTRTKAEILKGDLHPASNEFINKFYGPKTSQIEINRLLDELGIDSAEHQGLNAATIDKIKRASGVKGEFGNESGTISQASLSDQLNKIYGNNLPTMFKPEHLKDLKDLSDIANLTEPRKGVHSVNTSNSEILAQENRAKAAAKETASKIGAGVAEAKVNAILPGVGTIGRSILKGRAEQKALDLEKIKKAEESKRRLSPIAGIGTKIKDIGNE
jgi:hypothetical protein